MLYNVYEEVCLKILTQGKFYHLVNVVGYSVAYLEDYVYQTCSRCQPQDFWLICEVIR